MKRVILLVSVLLLVTLVLSACSQQATFSPEMSLAVVNTVAALQTRTAAAFTSTPLSATYDPLATFTSVPTLASTPAPTGTPMPIYWISEWSDDNYLLNTTVKARETFTKTWTLTNGGTATWQKDYTIIQVSGESMGVESIPLGAVVAPGGTVKVTMTLTAPASLGSHRANFMLRTPEGLITFGTGDNANLPFFVQIQVSNYFAVTGAEVKYTVPSGASCPVDIQLKAKLSANGSGEVTYYFATSQGHTETYAMNFSGEATQESSPVKFTVANPGDLTVAIYVDNPNHQTFPSITIPSPCSP